MNRAYVRQAPVIRFVSTLAALTITLSLGSFIDLLASPHFSTAEHERPVIVASRS